jgi:hypothetical protein
LFNSRPRNALAVILIPEMKNAEIQQNLVLFFPLFFYPNAFLRRAGSGGFAAAAAIGRIPPDPP